MIKLFANKIEQVPFEKKKFEQVLLLDIYLILQRSLAIGFHEEEMDVLFLLAADHELDMNSRS